MNHFELRDGELHCEAVPLSQIAKAVGTPVYVYSSATLERHFNVLASALREAGLKGEDGGAPLVAYAVKANPNLSVLATLARLGAGADTVSEGEIRRALAAGVPASRIVFSGVGKQAGEIAFALQSGISEINVESEPEMRLIARVAGGLGQPARIAFRVNPDVTAGGHAKIATGGADNKFGVSFSEAERLYAEAAADPWLRPVGLTCHIGSQITALEPMEAAFRRMRELVERLRARGLEVRRLDLGGGLGVPYFNQPEPPSPADYAEMVARVTKGLDVGLAFEPGRVIAANAGILLAEVLHIHLRPEGRRFVVLDAAMNDLIRPAMYDAYHDLRPVRPRSGPTAIADVVGPVCETGDTFTRDRELPPLEAGDLVAFMSAGAYGASMSSEYNSRLLVPEVLVRGAEWAVVRPRPTYDDMLARETRPPWLDQA
ncbi:diaminopimelate decarboxylase [Phenylobacterium parvum]|uniref:Diaminopimelate decarboxylase n=1 Tax=Phenylobacterium parvum TaxID=2201350 RepID=A0A2Z3HTH2_9CAUL|nr:diaminopimelate decarboxylase [Phenylobacterium parvum]AWM76671.1 diaminopimelate decarboxylase [Phenylobacterium parvum]